MKTDRRLGAGNSYFAGRKMMKVPVLLVLAGVLVAGCSGKDGRNAEDGTDTLVSQELVPAGTECADGGMALHAGPDLNDNGELDADEVTVTQYICNGTDGAGGFNALVSVVDEPAGDHCINSGRAVQVGLDLNRNNILDPMEITSTEYVCHGSAGVDGASGLDMLTVIEADPDDYCVAGGSKVTSGLDTNQNTVLDAGEITSTAYVCNGSVGDAGPGVVWVEVSDLAIQAVANTGYLALHDTERVVVTLPETLALGEVVQVMGIGTGGWRIAQNADQLIVTTALGVGVGHEWTPRDSTRSWSAVASSADGTKLVAAVYGGHIYTSTNSGATWVARESPRAWTTVTSSADGTRLTAAPNNGLTYSSTDSGETWMEHNVDLFWTSRSASADGMKLVATVEYSIYASNDAGVSWGLTAAPSVYWGPIASSADGSVVAAASSHGNVFYVSTDSGISWSERSHPLLVNRIAMSADGTKLVTTTYNGQIHTSTDTGVTWTARDSVRNWTAVTSSADGNRLAAAGSNSFIYLSGDSGLSWHAQGSTRDWTALASSVDGIKLAATSASEHIYTSSATTTRGTGGGIVGGSYESIHLQYLGNNTFGILGFTGHPTAH